MTLGRNKCKYFAMGSASKPQKVMPHDEFIDRIRKSLYFGSDTPANEMEVSRPLAEYAADLFSEPHRGHSLNRLNTVAASSVHATPCSLIMALIYLDRLHLTDPGYTRRITPQELFIVSMMISTKFYAGHDEEIYLSDWAEDGDMTEDRLKQLEIEFLCAIEWNIYISNEQFFNKLTSIEKTLARREGLRRGWLTYSELMQMLPSFTLAKFLFSNITVMAVSYAASVMTIAGAFFLASQIPGCALQRKTQTSATNATATTNGIGSAMLPKDTILPATTTHAQNLHHRSAAATATAGTAAGRNDAIAGSVTIEETMKRNASCLALSVEAEMLKLERQYRAEVEREDMRHRRNEIRTESRLTLPEAAQEKQLNVGSGGAGMAGSLDNIRDAADVQRNWFALKEEYSERRAALHAAATHDDDDELKLQQKQQEYACFTDCIINMNLSNCSGLAFWNLFTDAAQQSFVRLPLMWFKFM